MADVLTKEQRHKNMKNIRGTDTKIEIILRKALWAKGYRYRKNYSKLPGKPDIVLTKYKIAIFCDGEFFHGKDWEVLKPRLEKSNNSEWYSGTANAIYQNMNYMEQYNPEYVLILSGDHIYKMDYEVMLDFHKENNADVTIATMPVPLEEASRFGIVIADEDKRIQDFEEKPEHPRSNLASMGIYIFSWKVLKEALTAMKDQSNCDFGKHIIPYCHEKKQRLFAYEYNGYWKDVGTLGSYWEGNMELIDIIPEFNL